MTEAILAVNAGSSSIKFALYACGSDVGDLTPLADGEIEGIGAAPQLTIRETAGGAALKQNLPNGSDYGKFFDLILKWITQHSDDFSLVAAGHRIVHGGADFGGPVLITDPILVQLEKLIPLAPLHQPHNLAAVKSMAIAAPGLLQVACFDTGFHQTNSPLATTFGLPRALTDEGVRRYGFHGLSYEYIASVLPHYAASAAEGRVIVAHLGHGASMCAMRERRSVATTMGFTALDGLLMGRRCGTLDPGVILYLIKEKGMDYEALTDLLYHRSGLFGVSGISDDMRDLLANPTKEAKEAIDLFIYRIGRALGSLAATLGGLDVLVFTGGIGAHAAVIRERVCRDAQWLGVKLDSAANKREDKQISLARSPVSIFVIPTDENLMIARHTAQIVRC